ncbi:MAG: 3'-5' exonuclease [Tissierellia bacterium]|nr:3'-5' exonuclease [Tissierellia bacterium]
MDLSNLNDRQKEAVLEDIGPILVLAGAGSGKTRVLTTKIAHLIKDKNIYEGNLVAITFTNKAANEMKMRVSNLLDKDVSDLWIGTFHSICVRILRRSIDKLGYDRSFSIYDTSDQRSLVKEIINDLGYKNDINPKEALNIISSCKNAQIDPESFLKINTFYTKQEEYYKIYKKYEEKKFEYNALDFDDLIEKTLELFAYSKEVREYYQKKFEYVFVDEYQDTNKSQYELVKFFSGFHKNICVVGDADQSIYSFRGADINNILDFEKDFKDAKIIKLEQNYRSTQNILDVANRLIKNNEERKEKNLWTKNLEGEKVIYNESNNENEEANFVAEEIKTLRREGYKFNDIAILYRTNAQSRSFEEIFMKNGFNYRLVGGLKFYDRKEIKDIISYLKVLVNEKDNIAFKRIINEPKRGIGNKTIDKLEELSNSMNLSMMEVASDRQLRSGLSSRINNALDEFYDQFKNLIENKKEYEIVEFIKEVLDKSGYIDSLSESYLVENRARLENIDQFISAAAEYQQQNPSDNIIDYLESLSLLSDVDKTEDDNNSISLMTIHAAKGLEFPICFVVGMDDYLFPSKRSLDEGNIEEERRLFYVAMTRAEEKLYLTSAKNRRSYGKPIYYRRSRFIEEIIDDLKFIEQKTPAYTKRQSKEIIENYMTDSIRRIHLNKENKIKRAKNEEFKVGDKIHHKKWGEGLIVQIKEQDEGNDLTVSFNGKGLKHLNQNYAPIKKV